MKCSRIMAGVGAACCSIAATLTSAVPAQAAIEHAHVSTTARAVAMSLPDSSVDRARRQRIVDTLINRLERLYVFPGKVPALAAVLRERVARGQYDHITSAPAFADTLTNHLRDVLEDRHLALRFMVPRRRAPAQTTTSVQRREPTGGVTSVEVLPSNIGYLALDGFNSIDEVDAPYANAMNKLAATDALIIDIRQNSGGWPHSVALLASYLVGKDSVHINSLRFREGDSTMHFWTNPVVSGRKFGPDKPVYVLTSARTFSAAEEFAYGMKALRRATIIGEQTQGGANPGRATMLDDDIAAFIPFAEARNPITGGNWEGTGVTPDIRVLASVALDRAIEEARKRLSAERR